MELPMREREIDVERKQKGQNWWVGQKSNSGGGEGREGIRAEKKGTTVSA